MPVKPHLRTYFEEDKVQCKQVPGEVVLGFSQGQLVEEAHAIVPAHTQRAGRAVCEIVTIHIHFHLWN